MADAAGALAMRKICHVVGRHNPTEGQQWEEVAFRATSCTMSTCSVLYSGDISCDLQML